MREPPASDDRDQSGAEPVAERVISDVDTLKALSDPLRLRLLETMSIRHREAWTVKRLAAELGVGATKLYHHINLLEERGLITVAGKRVVSGIIESSYRVAQRSLRLDRALLAGGAVPAHVDELLRTVLDGVRMGIEDSIRSGLADLDPDAHPTKKVMLARGLARVPRDRAAELHERIGAIFREFEDLPEVEDGVTFGFVVGLFPLPAHAAKEDSDR